MAGLDFPECISCGGKCCKVDWTVFATPREIERLEAFTGQPAREFAALAPLPAWEREDFGEENLLWPRAETAEGEVPQLRKAADGGCVFLDDDGLCTVHPARPLMCRLYPYWYRADAEGRVTEVTRDRGYPGPMPCEISDARADEVQREARGALVRLAEGFERALREWEAEKAAAAPALRKRLAGRARREE